jgi:hypothetical protein
MKNLKKIGYLIIILSSFLSLSCETIVDEIDISRFNDLKEKVVVTSFISPTEPDIVVKLNKTVPLFGTLSGKYVKTYDPATGDSVLYYKSDQYIPDAKVSISDSKITKTLKYDSDKLSYTLASSEFNIMVGVEYSLKIEWRDQVVTAKTKVPVDQVLIENLEVKEFEEKRSSFFGIDTLKGLKVDFDFKDAPGKPNYYKAWGELSYTVNYPNFKQGTVIYLPKKLFSYLFWPDDEITGVDRYQTDKGKDGQTLKSIAGEIRRRDVLNCQGEKGFESKGCLKARDLPTEPRNLEIQLWNMSKELYDYQISLRVFNETSNNPFAEPLPVYSNVNGGLGIFAGYNASSVTRRL